MRGQLLAGLAAAGLVGVAVAGCSDEPDPKPELHQRVLPVVERYLEEHPDFDGVLADRSSSWFCSEHIIEIRERGDQLLVGLVANCDEYVALDGALGAGSGYRGPKLVTLDVDDEVYTVASVESAKDGAAHRESVEAMFTPAGVRAVFDRDSHELENTAAAAKAAFGLAPDAPVIPGR